MKFNRPNCPECKEPADKITESILANAGLVSDSESNSFEYDGQTDVNWDSQVPAFKRRRVEIGCSNGHSWTAKMIEA